MRAGFIPFCLSPRNTPKGLAELIKATNTAFVYHTLDSTVQELLSAASDIIEHEGRKPLQTLTLPTFIQLHYSVPKGTPLPPLDHPEENETAMILHSTGYSKDIISYSLSY